MKCPICTTTDLLMTERMGIEIDYCPQCRGVWLDRGELDKIIERSMGELPPAAPHVSQPVHSAPQPYNSGHGYHDKHHDDRHGYRGKHSFWRDLFD
ncbi:MAG: zf-TFIIB domain-containing protein [Sideroxydans sp.]|nr:zf-TFIIB domain-containing protein [Sideroxydans sp.]